MVFGKVLRFRWPALAIGLVLLSGCKKQDAAQTSSAGGADKIKIGFVVKQPEEPWFQLEWRFAQQAADKDGFELIKIAAPDGEKALGAIDNLASSGAQGFVICTPDVKLGPAIVAKAQSDDLKVIAVDDQFIGSDGKPMTDVPYLGISARKIGQSVGQALIDEMKKRGWSQDDTAVCVITFDELDTARERTEGAIEAIEAAGFPDSRIFKASQKTSDVPGAFDAANILLTQHAEVKRWLICGMNDSAVLGAVRATEGRGFNADNVIGIGINGTDCIAEFEKPQKTAFYASALLQAKLHGFQTADMMYNWIANGTEPPKDTRTIGVLIDRDNFQRVLQDQGIR
jgi:L-arabinose transport system substrate-binding protein